ncbi:multicopper oxidase family protein [Naasia sp. SYSU D00057]|uniref:multicopper oxidase family protein n=1 Tax=Naasia sp. SYSU D00057 TaxID=2817380 RepID=UPI001B304D45|nr:multicopper oxidase family protein [Naasia sp. SYSU D00057]
MSTSLLLLLDLALGGACAGAWAGATVLAARTRTRQSTPAAALVGVAMLLVLAQAGVAALLAGQAWGLVQEKLVFAVPLQLAVGIAVAVVTLPVLLGRVRPRPTVVLTALVAASASAVAGVLARVLIGYPLTAVPAIALLLLVAVTTWLTAALLRRDRRQVVGAGALAGLLVVASTGYAWLSDIASPGAIAAHAHAATSPASAEGTVSVADLRTPADAPGRLRHFDLTARQQDITSPGGREFRAQTFGAVGGPELRVEVGELVEVTLLNEDIEDGVTLHWHGYDVPNGEDGVAGATQEAVLPGESFTYRFVADEPGTYWYHTHQSSADGIRRGLFGTLVVLPVGGIEEQVDVTVPLHTFGSTVWLGASDLPEVRRVMAGPSARLRLVNTDQIPHRFLLSGAEYRVAAVDGREIAGGAPVIDRSVRVPAGGRVDLVFTVPETGVVLTTEASSAASLAIAPQDVDPSEIEVVDRGELDLLSYGERGDLQLPASMTDEEIVLDRQPRFLGGLPANAYTVNGAVFPHIENIEVTEGQVVRLTVANRNWETHPMHLHGHHVLVLSRNGVPATGAPLWLDTFDVQPGEVWQVMLVADNPGIWMDHCHNLDHADEGMMMALTYRGVTTPYDHTGISG